MKTNSDYSNLTKRLHRFLTAGLLLLTLALTQTVTPAQSASTGSVAGSVSETGGYFIPGAEVRIAIAGGTLTAVTDRAGQFRIDGVPPGPVRVTVDYLGYKPASQDLTVSPGSAAAATFVLQGEIVHLDTYKVESVREGQSRAINQQRASNTISNIISSDAIGNLPDRTIGEALGRLPGVNVVDDSFASIRGTAAQYNSVTLDGDRFSPGGSSILETQVTKDTRAADLSMIPAEIVGGIEVIKALTPDKEADSFGGTINLVTRSAFELKKRSINGNASYIYNDNRDGDGYAGSITYMDVLNKARTLGIAATLTYRKEKKWSDKYEISYYNDNEIPVGASGNGTNAAIAAVGAQGISEYDTRLNFNDSAKLGATINLDWKPADGTELHFRTFYEGNDTDQGRYRTRFRQLRRWDSTSTSLLETGKQVRYTSTYEESTLDQDVIRLGIDGKTTLPFGTLEYGVRYGDTSADTDLQRYVFEPPGTGQQRLYSWKADRSDPQLPVISITHIASGSNGLYYNQADRRIAATSGIRLQNATEDEDTWSANTDYTFALNAGKQRIDIKIGAKYRGKDRQSRPNMIDYNYTPPATPPADFYLATYDKFTVVAEPKDILNGSMATMGPYVSLQEVFAYFNKYKDTAFTMPDSDEMQTLNARKYDVSEDIYAGYAMATAKLGRLEIIGGARWEKTKTGYTWYGATDRIPVTGGNDYSKLYPGLLLNYRFNKNFIARAAYTNTLARPNYGDLVPYSVKVDTEADSGTGGYDPDDYPATQRVYLGNPGLKAQQSQNFDLSLEYYFNPSGVLSASYFHKDLKNIIYRSQWVDPTDSNVMYFQDRNGSTGKINGIEFSAQWAFTFLPGPLDGLGINANATFTDGYFMLDELVPGTTDTYQSYKVDFLPEQPEKVYNVQLWWEKYGFTARVAMSYVGEYVRTAGGLTSLTTNYATTRWDASLSYRVTKNLTIYLEGRNLSNEVTAWYNATGGPETYIYPGASFTGGVKFRF